MADTRTHRGAHPEDSALFGEETVPVLRRAVGELSWLLTHGYSVNSALKLVGDRHELRKRQRVAVRRASCSDGSLERRGASRLSATELEQRQVFIDGYNLLTTIEAALGGGVILACRDGCYRDMASMQGTYRKVLETEPALARIRDWLDDRAVAACHWYLDRPVSNSGRLKQVLLDIGSTARAQWTVDLVPDPDRVLTGFEGVVISADSQVIEGCNEWHNLAREIVVAETPEAWIIVIGGAV